MHSLMITLTRIVLYMDKQERPGLCHAAMVATHSSLSIYCCVPGTVLRPEFQEALHSFDKLRIQAVTKPA